MNYFSKFQKLSMVKDALQDEESNIIFNARLEYLVTRNNEKYLRKIYSLNKKWECSEVEKKLNESIKGIIIYGCGLEGKENRKILELCNHTLSYWCDGDVEKQGAFVEGVQVLSPWEVVNCHKNYLVIIGSKRYRSEMYRKLQVLGFDINNILIPRLDKLCAVYGTQYFDVFSPIEQEYIIDAGAYIGDTIAHIQEWTEGNYAKIYSFEPEKDIYQKLNDNIRKSSWKNIETYNIAVWDKQEQLCFVQSDTSSCIRKRGSSVVKGRDLDSIVGENIITFIKMDVEGSELKALHGATKIIINNRPRLAISIYHKPEDIIEIPEYLLTLVPEYKFYIRHYATNIYETVLYATI